MAPLVLGYYSYAKRFVQGKPKSIATCWDTRFAALHDSYIVLDLASTFDRATGLSVCFVNRRVITLAWFGFKRINQKCLKRD